MRQPDAPIGWPIAIAPPLTLIFEVSQPISWFTAQRLRRERLVDLHQVELVGRPAGLRERPARRADRTHAHDLRLEAGRRERRDPRERRRGRVPRAFAADITTTAAAPSLRPDALAAVTLPSFENAGRRPASASTLTPWRTNSSVSNGTGSPFFCGSRPARSRRRSGPPSARPRPCSATPPRTCPACSREIAYCFATFSAVVPMWYWL